MVNTVGEVLSPAWKDLFHSSRQPLFGGLPIYSFSGKDVLNSTIWPVKSVWHGLGQAWGGGGEGGGIESSPPGTCGGWRSASPLAVGLAGALGGQAGGSLLAPQRVHCNKALVALCIEATSPSNTFDRRRRSAEGGNTDAEKEMLGLSDHVQWLKSVDRSHVEKPEARQRRAKIEEMEGSDYDDDDDDDDVNNDGDGDDDGDDGDDDDGDDDDPNNSREVKLLEQAWATDEVVQES